MSRGPCTFRKADVRRAIEAVEAAGKTIAGIETRPDGSVFIRVGQPLAADQVSGHDDMDTLIEEMRADGQARRTN